MSEEEQKAIKNLKYSTSIPSENTIKIILDLIDKQQKEIEEKNKIIEDIKEIIFNPATTTDQDYSEILYIFKEYMK